MVELGWLLGLGLQCRCLERRDKEKNTLSKKSMWTAQVCYSRTIVVTVPVGVWNVVISKRSNEDDQ